MNEPELPDLKKKEKERKKAGAAWSGGSAGSDFTGATGGLGEASGMAQTALSGSARAAAQAFEGFAGRSWISQFLGRSWAGQLVARMMGTLAGKLALAAFAAMLIGGAAALGVKLFSGQPANHGKAFADLQAPSSSLRARQPGGSSALEYLKGQLKYDQAPVAKTAPPTKAEAPTPTQPEQTAPKTEWGDVLEKQDGWRTNRLAHNLSMAQLSSNLGSSFGGTNIFKDGPKFGSTVGVERTKLAALTPGAAKTFKNARIPRAIASGRAFKVNSRRAIGQLKAARTLSQTGANQVGDEAGRVLTSDAFDGHITNGGTPPPTPIGPPGGTGGGGGGTGGGGNIVPPPIGPPEVQPPPGFNNTPYQQALDQIHDMAKQAAQLKSQGTMLMMLGLLLIGIGAYLVAQGPLSPGFYIGIALLAFGAMMLGMGLMMIMMAGKLADKAKQMADQMKSATGGNTDINNALHTCVDRALNSPQQQDCDQAHEVHPGSTIPEAAQTESQSGYTVTGEPTRDIPRHGGSGGGGPTRDIPQHGGNPSPVREPTR